MKQSFLKVILAMSLVVWSGLGSVQAQCVFPTYNAVISNSTTDTSWQGPAGGLAGGTRSKRTGAIGTHGGQNVYMRVTWVARSSAVVRVPNWDYTGGVVNGTFQANGYPTAWQPIVVVASSASPTDTTWAEFLVQFAAHNNTNDETNFDDNRVGFPCLALSVVDCDGNGGTNSNNIYREIVWITAPSMPYGIVGSDITSGQIGNWMVNVSDYPQYTQIDTTIKAAIVQMNFDTIYEFSIRAGVIGTRTSSTQQREFSFWLQPFGLTVFLPVQYAAHTIRGTTGGIVMDWTTSSEENNSHFEVEKSTDGVFWTKIGRVEGCGNCQHNSSYEFTDNNPVTGHNLYRLKQMDYDGKHQYSPVQKYFWETSERNILIYPNPAQNILTIEGVHNPDVKVYSMTGSLLFEQIGSNLADIGMLPAGVYFIEVRRGADLLSRQRIVKE